MNNNKGDTGLDGQSSSNLAFKIIHWLANNELWLLALAAPLLLFPRGITPWLGLLIAALAWAARWLAFGRPSRSTPLDTPLVLLLLCTLMGVAISIVPAWSANRAWSLVLGWLAYYAFVNWVRTERRANIVIGLTLLLTLGVTMLSLVGTDWSRVRLLDLPWLYQHLPTLLRGLPGSGVQAAAELFNPRWVGITLGFLLPIPAALALFSRRSKLRLASAVVFVLGGLVLLLSQSIQGLVGLVVGMLFVLIWRWRWFWVVIPVGLVGLGIAVAWYGPLRMVNSLLSLQNPLGAAVALRLDIWSRGLAMLHDMPFSGIGLNAFQIIQADSYPGYAIGLEPHAHNLYLQTALDLGLPGLLAFVWLLVAWFLAVWRNYHRTGDAEQRLWLVGLAAAVVSYLAHGFLDAMMLGAKPGVALWFILALGVAIPVGEQPVQERAVTLAHKGLRRLPLALLVGSLVLLAFLQPAALPMNCGVVAAQHVLVDFDNGSPPAEPLQELAQRCLDLALRLDSQRVYAYELLGRMAAWQGEHPSALAAFSGRVEQDGSHDQPLRVYAPAEYWLSRVQGDSATENTWQALLRVYNQWLLRYPQRAEHAVRVALVHSLHMGQPEQAMQVLQQALDGGAQPVGLLRAAMQEMRP